jgi:hypothetical protein
MEGAKHRLVSRTPWGYFKLALFLIFLIWQIGGTGEGVEGAKANGDVELSAGAAAYVGQMRTAQETSTPSWSVRLVLYDGSVPGDLLLGAHFAILAVRGRYNSNVFVISAMNFSLVVLKSAHVDYGPAYSTEHTKAWGAISPHHLSSGPTFSHNIHHDEQQRFTTITGAG